MLEQMEGIDPAWIIAVATILTALVSVIGSEYLRGFILKLFGILRRLWHITKHILRPRWRRLFRILFVILSAIWVPVLVSLFWSDLGKYMSGREAWVTSILVGSFGTVLAMLLLFRLKSSSGIAENDKSKYIPNELGEPNRLATTSVLVSDVAVEMSDHITIIIGMTDLLLSNTNLYLKTRKSRKYVEAISKASRMIRIANRAILDLYHQIEVIDDFDLNKLCDDVLTLMLHNLKIRNIGTETQYSKSSLIVSGDKSKIEHALIELISASINTMTFGATLVLEMSPYEHEVKIVASSKEAGASLKYIGEIAVPFTGTGC